MKNSGQLALSDGTIFSGKCIYERDEVITGELVFSTSMTGYTELITDPSYHGQIVVLANPEIGNYGVNFHDFQSDGIQIKALVVRNVSRSASSFRARLTIADWFMREGVPLLYDIDTRALITHIRECGAMMAAVAKNHGEKLGELVQHARSAPSMTGMRLSHFVGKKRPDRFEPCFRGLNDEIIANHPPAMSNVVVMDFGVKRSILLNLAKFGARITLVPGDSSPEEIWAAEPDGLFLSNGPGDPDTEKNAVSTVRALLGKLPIFGVCLGHQILAQALGCSTYKLKFGHRGSNQPVKCSDTTIMTTAQNHGFAVEPSRDLAAFSEITNISDGTNEGIDLPEQMAFSVQFHPEGAPGPLDGLFYFEKFMTCVHTWKKSRNADGYPEALARIAPW